MTAESSLERFRELVRIPTISRTDETTTDWAPFDLFVAALPRNALGKVTKATLGS